MAKKKMKFLGAEQKPDGTLSIYGQDKTGVTEFTDCIIVGKKKEPLPKNFKPIKRNGHVVGFKVKVTK